MTIDGLPMGVQAMDAEGADACMTGFACWRW